MHRLLWIMLVSFAVACAASVPSTRDRDDGPLRVSTVYAPHRFDPARNPQLYAMTVHAESDADFSRRHAAARAAGPGHPLPPGVRVDAWLELEGLDRLRSSITGRFEVFRLEIGGELVADLAAGLNAVARESGHGWWTLEVDLPADLLLPGTPARLVQRRSGAATDLELCVDF
ncbi:MAG: hypothetical protein ACYTG2_18115 [Planctomycetota bacterium]|jgi:hypothetical protein